MTKCTPSAPELKGKAHWEDTASAAKVMLIPLVLMPLTTLTPLRLPPPPPPPYQEKKIVMLDGLRLDRHSNTMLKISEEEEMPPLLPAYSHPSDVGDLFWSMKLNWDLPLCREAYWEEAWILWGGWFPVSSVDSVPLCKKEVDAYENGDENPLDLLPKCLKRLLALLLSFWPVYILNISTTWRNINRRDLGYSTPKHLTTHYSGHYPEKWETLVQMFWYGVDLTTDLSHPRWLL